MSFKVSSQMDCRSTKASDPTRTSTHMSYCTSCSDRPRFINTHWGQRLVTGVGSSQEQVKRLDCTNGNRRYMLIAPKMAVVDEFAKHASWLSAVFPPSITNKAMILGPFLSWFHFGYAGFNSSVSDNSWNQVLDAGHSSSVRARLRGAAIWTCKYTYST